MEDVVSELGDAACRLSDDDDWLLLPPVAVVSYDEVFSGEGGVTAETAAEPRSWLMEDEKGRIGLVQVDIANVSTETSLDREEECFFEDAGWLLREVDEFSVIFEAEAVVTLVASPGEPL